MRGLLLTPLLHGTLSPGRRREFLGRVLAKPVVDKTTSASGLAAVVGECDVYISSSTALVLF